MYKNTLPRNHAAKILSSRFLPGFSSALNSRGIFLLNTIETAYLMVEKQAK